MDIPIGVCTLPTEYHGKDTVWSIHSLQALDRVTQLLHKDDRYEVNTGALRRRYPLHLDLDGTISICAKITAGMALTV